jgi:hypothetical protein
LCRILVKELVCLLDQVDMKPVATGMVASKVAVLFPVIPSPDSNGSLDQPCAGSFLGAEVIFGAGMVSATGDASLISYSLLSGRLAWRACYVCTSNSCVSCITQVSVKCIIKLLRLCIFRLSDWTFVLKALAGFEFADPATDVCVYLQPSPE